MFEKHVFEKLKTIEDYKNNGYKKESPKRDKIKICFIDDKGFNTDFFRSTGYKDVDVKFDFNNANDVAAYDIIACDIDGIGMKLDEKRQGLAVAETIIAAFPEKVVLIYSSNNPFDYSENYHSIGDGYFNKSLSNNDIAKLFDEYAAVFYDEIAAWKKIEKRLRKDGFSNKTIAFTENLYVRSLEDKVNLFKTKKASDYLELAINGTKLLLTITTILSRFIH